MTKPSPELATLFEPVLEWLDAGGDDVIGFDMGSFYDDTADHHCGTTCCISGAVGYFNPDLNMAGIIDHNGDIKNRSFFADEALLLNYGMSQKDMYGLFLTNMDATPSQAAATVRHWIETGDVIWEDEA